MKEDIKELKQERRKVRKINREKYNVARDEAAIKSIVDDRLKDATQEIAVLQGGKRLKTGKNNVTMNQQIPRKIQNNVTMRKKIGRIEP